MINICVLVKPWNKYKNWTINLEPFKKIYTYIIEGTEYIFIKMINNYLKMKNIWVDMEQSTPAESVCLVSNYSF